MAAVTIFKITWHVEAFGTLRMSSMEAFYGLSMYFLAFENHSPLALIAWEMSACLFPVKVQQRFVD